MKIRYKNLRISGEKLTIIEQANEIIEEYRQAGIEITLRQLYYQFVARDLIPNAQKEYKKLGEIIAHGRMAGLIDWDAISDLTRNFRKRPEWDSPADAMQAIADQFRMDVWAGQPHRPEVWIEKDAGLSVITDVCRQNGVGYFSCRGYTSLSEVWAASQRLVDIIVGGQRPVILHFGDHDPSGVDMTRDIIERLLLFVWSDLVRDHGADPDSLDARDSDTWPFEVQRLALNMPQIKQYKPPPNPAKITDSRAAKYIEKYGRESWELDALNPTIIRDLITKELKALQDRKKYNQAVEAEDLCRRQLAHLSSEWESAPVQKILKKITE